MSVGGHAHSERHRPIVGACPGNRLSGHKNENACDCSGRDYGMAGSWGRGTRGRRERQGTEGRQNG